VKTQFKRGFAWRDEKGMYRRNDNLFPSVTTCLGLLDEFLWVHINEICRTAKELGQKISTGEMVEMWREYEGEWSKQFVPPIEALCDGHFVSKAGLRFLKSCADRGTLCHELIVDYATGAQGGNLEERVEELIFEKHLSCSVEDTVPFGKQLWKWLELNRPDIWYAEVPVFNETLGYAGTCDGVMYLNGQLLCFDCKTQGSYSAKRSHFAQIAAYARAEYIVTDTDLNLTAEMPTLMGEPLPCGILYVSPEKVGMRMIESKGCNLPQLYFDKLFVPALTAFTSNKDLPMPEQCAWID